MSVGRASGSPRPDEAEEISRAAGGAEESGRPLALPTAARRAEFVSSQACSPWAHFGRSSRVGGLSMTFEPIHDLFTGALVGSRSAARHRGLGPESPWWLRGRPSRLVEEAVGERLMEEALEVGHAMCCRLRRSGWELFVPMGATLATCPRSLVELAPRCSAREPAKPRPVALLPSSVFYDPALPCVSLMARWRRAGFRVAASVRSVGEGAFCLRPGVGLQRMELARAVVRGALLSARERRALRALVDRCRGTGTLLLARGVSAVRELRLLAELEIDLVSGPLYAPPLTPKAFMLHALRAGGAGDWTIEDIEAERGVGFVRG